MKQGLSHSLGFSDLLYQSYILELSRKIGNSALYNATVHGACQCCIIYSHIDHHHHHYKHQGLDPLIRSVSRVTAARANASSIFQLFSFLVACSGMISKGFGFVAFFASVKPSSV